MLARAEQLAEAGAPVGTYFLQAAIATVIDRLGAVADRGGEPGVNRATVERFFGEGAALQAWRQRLPALQHRVL